MEFQLLESFVEVAKTMNFTKAAQNLHITQSTMSSRIQKLENELEVPLFLRLSREIRLSHYGDIFLPFAEKCLQDRDLGLKKIEEEKGISQTQMRISSTNPFGTFIMPRILPVLYTTFPNINIQFLRNTGYSSEILKMVLDSQLDIAFINNVDELSDGNLINSNLIHCIPLYSDDLLLIAKSSHYLNQAAEISVQDLMKEHLISLDKRTSIAGHLQIYFEAQQVELTSYSDINSVAGIKEVVKQTEALTFLPRLFANEDIKKGNLIEIPISPPPKPMKTYMVFSKNHYVKQVSKLIRDKVITTIDELNLPCRIVN